MIILLFYCFESGKSYEIKQLDPGVTIVFGKCDVVVIPADLDALCDLFESVETGITVK